MPCWYTLGTARSRSRKAGNVGLAPGVLGVQGTASERHDRVALGLIWLRGWVGLQSGGGGKLVGEVGRPGVLPTPLASSSALRQAMATRGMEEEVGFRGHC
jgi:hypothetical protein